MNHQPRRFLYDDENTDDFFAGFADGYQARERARMDMDRFPSDQRADLDLRLAAAA